MAKLIVDLDDTLCNINHRRKYYKKNWGIYNKLCGNDSVVTPVLDLITAFYNYGYQIIILTGRSWDYELITRNWLTKHTEFQYKLIMKDPKDMRSSVEYKKEWLLDNADSSDYVIDDRQEIDEFCKSKNIGYIRPISMAV